MLRTTAQEAPLKLSSYTPEFLATVGANLISSIVIEYSERVMVLPEADELAITVPPRPAPMIMQPDAVMVVSAPLTVYVPSGKYRTPLLVFSNAIALLIAVVLLVAPVGSAPKSTTLITSANLLAKVLAVDEPVETTVEGLTGAVSALPLNVISDEPARTPALLYWT